MEIVWTKEANLTYLEIIENLKNRWTKTEINSFINLTNDILEKIINNQVVFALANEKLGIRKGIVHKNISLFYKEDKEKNKIYLITFFNNRMNPNKIKALLK